MAPSSQVLRSKQSRCRMGGVFIGMAPRLLGMMALPVIYRDVMYAGFAYVQGWTVVEQRRSSCRGAKTGTIH